MERKISAQQNLQILEEARQPNTTIAEVCRRHQISAERVLWLGEGGSPRSARSTDATTASGRSPTSNTAPRGWFPAMATRTARSGRFANGSPPAPSAGARCSTARLSASTPMAARYSISFCTGGASRDSTHSICFG